MKPDATVSLDDLYGFDHILPSECKQNDVWQKLNINQMCRSFIQGSNCNIMVYGPTNSGKTYSMFGDLTKKEKLKFTRKSKSCPLFNKNPKIQLRKIRSSNNIQTFSSNQGIIPRALRKIYALTDSVINVSFFEIYNDVVIDLLSNGAGQI